VAKLRVEAPKGEGKASPAKGSAGGAAKGARGGSRVIAVVGAMPTLARGRRVRVEGEWVMDKRFGAQLKARCLVLRSFTLPRRLNRAGCSALHRRCRGLRRLRRRAPPASSPTSPTGAPRLFAESLVSPVAHFAA
jgi:hypothetical protein